MQAGGSAVDGCVLGRWDAPVKTGCGGWVIVPAVHGRAPRAAAQPVMRRRAAARGRGLWAAGAIKGARGHAGPFGAFRRRLSPFSSMRCAV